MSTYFKALSVAYRDWKKAIVITVLTILRLIFGWSWISAGYEKLGWLATVTAPAGQPAPVSNSAGLIQVMIDHLAGPKVTHFDPLHLNNLFAWLAQNIFLGMPRVTDFLVVGFESLVGLLIILGFRVFWAALAAVFLNLQFFAAGSFNNFGYLWTDLALLKWAKAFEAIGIDGIVRAGKGKELL
ncbi:MAG TPA: hypothetical protein VMV44_07610 [Rectinemataceae bacterium]|nr:hypothetical protein [Rectinemataceae bacterium]